MTATINLPVVRIPKNARPAVDAFDIAAVALAELAAAPVVDIAGKYEIEFDTEVTLAGRKVDVKVLYANDIGEIDVFRLNAKSDPVEPEMSHWLSEEDYQRVFGDAEQMHFAKESDNAEAEREAYWDRRRREVIEMGMWHR